VPKPENIEPHKWKPGQSGNPAGYSRKRRQIDDLLALIDETNSAERAISKAWLRELLKGNIAHLREYLDRRDGPVPKTPDETGQPVRVIVEYRRSDNRPAGAAPGTAEDRSPDDPAERDRMRPALGQDDHGDEPAD
jgi:hypothetical protein